MPTTKSDIYTTQSAATGDNRADGRLLSGKVRQAQAVITLLTGETDAHVYNLVELPKGALIDPSQSFVQAENPAGTLVADIGVPSDPDALTAAALTLSSGGKVFFNTSVDEVPLYEVADGDELVSLTANTLTTPTNGAQIRVCITYVDRY